MSQEEKGPTVSNSAQEENNQTAVCQYIISVPQYYTAVDWGHPRVLYDFGDTAGNRPSFHCPLNIPKDIILLASIPLLFQNQYGFDWKSKSIK